MKTKICTLFAAHIAVLVGTANATPFYWHGDSWGDFDTAANWTVGDTASPYADTGLNDGAAIPGASDWIYIDASHTFNLRGGSYSVSSISCNGSIAESSAARTFSFTNGTITVTGGTAQRRYFLSLYSGATYIANGSTTWRFGWGGGEPPINVYNGARLDISCPITAQGLKLTVYDGGEFNFSPSSIGHHRGSSYNAFMENRGVFNAPNGYVWNGTMTSSGGTGSMSIRQVSGTMKLGGNISANGKGYPLNFSASGGTIEVSNTVGFPDITRAWVTSGSTVTVKVNDGATAQFDNLEYDSGATLIKTGGGMLVLAEHLPDTLTASNGTVRFAAATADTAAMTFASGVNVEFAAKDNEFGTVVAESGVGFSIDETVFISGDTVLASSDAELLAAVATGINGNLSAGIEYAAVVENGAVVLRTASANIFDATKSSDLSDSTAWAGGSVPEAGASVYIQGAGSAIFDASSPAFGLITVESGATLQVSGGTEASPVDLPAVALYYNARLLVSSGSVAQMTNTFTCAYDGVTLPVFEIATNAMAIVQSPDNPLVYSTHDKSSYHGYDYGFRIKNVSLKWYGTIKMFYGDARKTDFPHCRLTLGYAASDETSYIAVDCRGGRYLAAGEEYSSGRCRTPLVIATPNYGGRVIPVGTLLFRDYVRENQVSAGENQSYSTPGIFIGMTAEYSRTGNPDDIEYDVVFDGTTDLSVNGNCRIAGGAHVYLRGSAAQWRYVRTAWNDEDLYRAVILQGAATLTVENGAYLDICSNDTKWRGLQANGTVGGQTAFTVRDSRISMLNWSGSGSTVASIDNTLLDIGYLRSSSTLGNIDGVFNGFAAVAISNTFTIAAADVDRGNSGRDSVKAVENWNRFVKIGPPLTGTGSIAVSNKLSGTHAVYSMTVVVTNGANTATGTASVSRTASGAPAKLLFSDGANWAGTVVADGNVSLTNLVDESAAAAVSFAELRIDSTMPVRVWKTAGVVTANDSVNLSSPPTGAGEFSFVAMDEPIVPGDEIVLGRYPAAQPLPADTPHVMFSTRPAEAEEFVMLVARATKPGCFIIIK